MTLKELADQQEAGNYSTVCSGKWQGGEETQRAPGHAANSDLDRQERLPQEMTTGLD